MYIKLNNKNDVQNNKDLSWKKSVTFFGYIELC